MEDADTASAEETDDEEEENEGEERDVVALSCRSRAPASVRHDGRGRSNARTGSIDRSSSKVIEGFGDGEPHLSLHPFRLLYIITNLGWTCFLYNSHAATIGEGKVVIAN